MATNFKAYFIQCITNLHVGSGDASYGVVDKLVQRDPVTGYPTIHASSLKGALREHFENHETLKSSVNEIFGKENEDNDAGTYKFLNADLVALPIRCTYQQFVLGFDKKLADFVNRKAETITSKNLFSILPDENNIYGADFEGEIFAEDIQLTKVKFENPVLVTQNLITDRYATFKNDVFKSLVKNLPVIARNKVGKDKNLWYEEVVPHQTIFITFIGASTGNTGFENALVHDLIQIGGNASVGYGLCKFYEIKFS